MRSDIANLATRSKTNKGNYSKNSLGDVFFNGYLLKSKHCNLSINKIITYKSLLITL